MWALVCSGFWGVQYLRAFVLCTGVGPPTIFVLLGLFYLYVGPQAFLFVLGENKV